MSALIVENLNKYYGKFHCLNNISLTVESGSVFGLLGPNGAGKTTFVKSILGLVHSQADKIKINGVDTTSEQSRVGIGYLPEKFTFYPYYTVEAVVRFYGQMHQISKHELVSQMDYALQKLNIVDLKKKKLKELSKGQMQRTGIAGMLMGDNQFFILDEPFSGLDPVGIRELKSLILELKEAGKTIFINSHILAEMEKVCDSLAILNKGECLVSGGVEDLLKGQSLEDFFYNKVNPQ